MALEEPKYSIIKKTNNYEIRKYADRLAVETLEGSGENRAFSLLLNIFREPMSKTVKSL